MFRFTLLLTIALLAVEIPAQTLLQSSASPANVKVNRERGLNMLDDIKATLKEYYYDKTFRGIDLNARFDAAKARIKTLETNAQIFRAIAQVLIDFGDSHTRFFPPARANRAEYGFTMQMIGDNCFVTSVKTGSDAEKNGLKVGDRITTIGQFQVDRSNLWVAEYLIYELDPQLSITLKVVGLDNQERSIQFLSKFTSIKEREKEYEERRQKKRDSPYKCFGIDVSLIACKLETFSVEKKMIDKMMEEASKHPKMILDLRGNGGGYVKIGEYLTGHFFDRELKVAEYVMRGDKRKAVVAKPQKQRAFKGELVVLIDSDSASASEVFARTMQIEKRAKIVGDVSAGAVMTSYHIPILNSRGVPGHETISAFALNVSIADVVMSDGNRLENIGVMPDHPVGPSAVALVRGNDPVMAFAANLLGVKITPQDAGKMNFLHKKEENEQKEANDEGN